MVAEAQFVEAADHAEAAEPRGRERRQKSRSGEDLDHQEDRAERNETIHPGQHQPRDRVHQDSAESVHRQSC